MGGGALSVSPVFVHHSTCTTGCWAAVPRVECLLLFNCHCRAETPTKPALMNGVEGLQAYCLKVLLDGMSAMLM